MRTRQSKPREMCLGTHGAPLKGSTQMMNALQIAAHKDARGSHHTSEPGLHYDRDRGIPDYFAQQASLNPQKLAIVCDERSLTYAELDNLSSGIAHYLAAAGVGKGDIVALLVPRSLEAVLAKLAVLKAGAAYAPIDPAYPDEHIKHILGECEPKVIFIFDEFENKVPVDANGSAYVVDLRALLRNSKSISAAGAKLPSSRGDDIAYVMYTSGSTGKPKGVVITHRGIARTVLDQNYVEFRSSDVVLHATTISFDVCTTEIWGALVNGATLSVLSDANFSVGRLSEVIRASGVTVASLTTGLFNLFADYARGDLDTLRHMMFAGEVGSAEHARRFMKRFPRCKLTNAYGPTEATVYATAYAIPRDFEGDDLPIGCAIAHTGIHILDDMLNLVAPGIEGQLAISGDGVAVGYLKRPDLTEAKFVEIGSSRIRCYLTGDIAMMDKDGEVTFKGRSDRQVKINGKRIELDAIETALRRDPRLSEAAVICSQNATGKRIFAYLRPLGPVADKEDFVRSVLADLRNALPPFMIPSTAVVMDEFPMNRAGKIERSKLVPPELAEAAPPAEAESNTQKLLIATWKEVLGLNSIPLDRNCFELGATSLHIMRVQAAMEAKLGRRIEVTSLFSHPTVGSLASWLDSGDQASVALNDAAQRAAMSRRAVAGFRRNAS
jgi:amino acid adenylation domain-containing protein